MGYPSSAADYAEQTISLANIFGNDCNCRTIETPAGFVIINVARMPGVGDIVLICFCGRLDLTTVQGKALITTDGEAIEGDALDDADVLGVVTHLLNKITDTDDRPVI
ncbi:hypothetical protein JW309_04505 [Enterobacter bugandensis]|uniref:hypothetical protein n=1 Tax=Enterobacter bugandensis TaxID=881260 RepID=UPI001C5BA99F|nr:hypothetical protein [Enterobacter bugandensis]MBW4191546.1 hypothetical protein [Enterobacter bugandensis]